jgi:hypothetical protein
VTVSPVFFYGLFAVACQVLMAVGLQQSQPLVPSPVLKLIVEHPALGPYGSRAKAVVEYRVEGVQAVFDLRRDSKGWWTVVDAKVVEQGRRSKK